MLSFVFVFHPSQKASLHVLQRRLVHHPLYNTSFTCNCHSLAYIMTVMNHA